MDASCPGRALAGILVKQSIIASALEEEARVSSGAGVKWCRIFTLILMREDCDFQASLDYIKTIYMAGEGAILG